MALCLRNGCDPGEHLQACKPVGGQSVTRVHASNKAGYRYSLRWRSQGCLLSRVQWPQENARAPMATTLSAGAEAMPHTALTVVPCRPTRCEVLDLPLLAETLHATGILSQLPARHLVAQPGHISRGQLHSLASLAGGTALGPQAHKLLHTIRAPAGEAKRTVQWCLTYHTGGLGDQGAGTQPSSETQVSLPWRLQGEAQAASENSFRGCRACTV